METVLITGCSSGIGRAAARAFLDEEWTVYATAREPDDLAALEAAGARTARLDVTDPQDAAAVVERAVEETGSLDCLVNNAGVCYYGPVEDVPPRLVRRQFEVNVFGVHRLVREALPHMREAGDGTIVTVSSAAGWVSTPGSGVYSASKFAIEGLVDALRPEVASFGVDAVLLEPGPVATEFHERAVDSMAGFEHTEAYDYLYRFHEDRETLGGLGAVEVEEVTDAIVHAATCADPPARYPVGRVARLASWARYLPDGVRDAAYRLIGRVVR